MFAIQHPKLFAKERPVWGVSAAAAVLLVGGSLGDLLQSKHRTQGVLGHVCFRLKERCGEGGQDQGLCVGEWVGSRGPNHPHTTPGDAGLVADRAAFPSVYGPQRPGKSLSSYPPDQEASVAESWGLSRCRLSDEHYF